MNQEIYNKIDKIFCSLQDNKETKSFKQEVEFNTKKLYNQMLQSGFSEYIAVAECLDSLDKFASLIGEEKDIEKIKNLVSNEKQLKDNIQNTTSKKELSDDYDRESIEKIIQLVEGAAEEKNNLSSIGFAEQNDEIIYKENIENNKNNDNNFAKNKFNKKQYLSKLFTFLGVLLVTGLAITLVHFMM